MIDSDDFVAFIVVCFVATARFVVVDVDIVALAADQPVIAVAATPARLSAGHVPSRADTQRHVLKPHI